MSKKYKFWLDVFQCGIKMSETFTIEDLGLGEDFTEEELDEAWAEWRSRIVESGYVEINDDV